MRTYGRGDRDGVLSLLETERGRRLSNDWSEWKYVDDPYLSRFCHPAYMAARPLVNGDDSGQFSRRALADPENWYLSFLEVND